MKDQFIQLFFTGVLLLGMSGHAVSAQQVKIGWVENVTIGGNQITVAAKIDTGADNSSINAPAPEFYAKQGQEWVRFELETDSDETIRIDRPIARTTQVKTKKRGYQERAVIEMDICLGKIKKQVEINLVDRSHFKYQLLVGRSFLAPEFLVDSSDTFTVEPQCE